MVIEIFISPAQGKTYRLQRLSVRVATIHIGKNYCLHSAPMDAVRGLDIIMESKMIKSLSPQGVAG